jgi:protein-tyrosine-phosphatase
VEGDPVKILFVCTGNTCRSSMAKVIAEKILAELGQAGEAEISSRGTMARDGQAASPLATAVMQKQGLDLSAHQAALLKAEDIRRADIIIAMTESHKQQILTACPETTPNITVLNISDPFGGAEDDYQACAEEISARLKQLLPELLALKRENREGEPT